MPVISAILITVVVLAVWLAVLAVALLGMFRAIPVGATVVAVCVLLLTGGSVIVAVAAAMGVLIGVPVGLWVLVTIRISVRPRSVRASNIARVEALIARPSDAAGPLRRGRRTH